MKCSFAMTSVEQNIFGMYLQIHEDATFTSREEKTVIMLN